MNLDKIIATEYRRDLSKILTPEDFEKIDKEIKTLSMKKERLQDTLISYKKQNNISEIKKVEKQINFINEELRDLLEKQDTMYNELNLKQGNH